MLKDCKISGFSDEINQSIDKQIDVLQEIGQKYIELRNADGINVSDLTIQQAEAVYDKLTAAGIRVSSIGSPIGKINICDDFALHLSLLDHTLELAQLFETPYIRMFSFYVPERKAADYEAEVFRRTEQMIEHAVKKNITLLHENEKGIYGDIAVRCKNLMEHFYGENYKAVFDFANFVQCGQDTLEAYEMLHTYIEYVHVKDARQADGEVVLAGDGDGHVEELLKKLDANGYHGYLSLEPHLSNFVGFDRLEQGKSEKRFTDEIAAYKSAYGRLQQLLVSPNL